MSNPLTYWESLTLGVRDAVARDRIGAPVFVRWTLLVAQDTDEVERQLAEMLRTVSEWFDTVTVRMMALAPDDSSTLTVSAEFAGGQTALLTAGLSHLRPQIDFILLGNEGVAYQHESPSLINGRSFVVGESAAINALGVQLRDSLCLGSPIEPKT